MKSHFKNFSYLIFSLVFLPFALPAQVLEEVVVTAQKREQRLIDVPVSIATFGEAMMNRAGIDQLSDLNHHVPNVTITEDNGFLRTVRIRGVGSDSRNIGFDTRVGVYIDGVYLGQSPALNQSMVDVERVEVLRGPQGTLFGKNTVAGAINIISKKPSEEFEGSIRGTVSNLDGYQITAHANVPITENVASKFSVDYIKRDGYLKNLLDDRKGGSKDELSLRGMLSFKPSENLDILVSLDGSTMNQVPNFGDPITDTFGAGRDTVAPRRNETSQDTFAKEMHDIFGASFSATYHFGNDYDVRFITSYRNTDFNTLLDIDHDVPALLIVDYTDRYEQITNELQLISPPGSKLEYVLGLYHYEQEGKTNRFAFSGDGLIVGPGDFTANLGTLDTTNYAVFANASYDVNERIEIGLGLRYSYEKKDVDWEMIAGEFAFIGFATGTFNDDRTDEKLLPMASVNYALQDDLVAYFRYAEGYKSGGYNLDFVGTDIFPNDLEFSTEKVKNYEIGLKGEIFDGRLQFSTAAFYTEFSDYQVNQFRDVGGGNQAIVIGNAAQVETMGIELEFTASMSDELLVTGSLGLLDAEFKEFPNAGDFNQDLSGNKLPGAADVTAALSFDYLRPMEWKTGWSFFARLDYLYQDEVFSTVDNVRTQALAVGPPVEWGGVDDYHLVNGRIGISDEAAGWEVSVYAHNIFDTEYSLSSDRDFLGVLLDVTAPPRIYGIEFGYNF